MRRLLILFSFFACYSCKPELPKGILPAEKMEAIYWDLMRADEMSNYYRAIDTTYVKLKKQEALYEAIFRIHQISKDEFNKSKAYYELHPELLKIVLDSIHARGEKMLQEQDTIQKETPPAAPDTNLKTITIDSSKQKPRKGLLIRKAN
jgi:hypothetical protein